MYSFYDGLDQLRGQAPVVPTLRCLFLCGGPGVAASVAGLAPGCVVVSHDVTDGVEHDLLAPALQASVLRAIAAGKYDFVYGSPPGGPALAATNTNLVLFIDKALAVAEACGVAWGLEHPALRYREESLADAPPPPTGRESVRLDPAVRRLADSDTAAYADVTRDDRTGLCYGVRVLGHRHFIAALGSRTRAGLLGAGAPRAGLAVRRGAEATAAWRASVLGAASDAGALLAREATLERDHDDVDDVRLVPVTSRSLVAI